MCTVLLPPGVNPVPVKYIISYQIIYQIISYIVSYQIIYHIISYQIISYIISYQIIYQIIYIISNHIVYHIISNHISYYIKSYIKSYISYQIFFLILVWVGHSWNLSQHFRYTLYRHQTYSSADISRQLWPTVQAHVIHWDGFATLSIYSRTQNF